MCHHIFECYQDLIFGGRDSSFDRKLLFPFLSEPYICAICREAQKVLVREPNVLNIVSPCVIVGDLHGHILDLLRILQQHGLPGSTQYLFLGDYVDRGDFGLETITLILVMKILFPKSVHVIRGNHEFEKLCSTYGFKNEILDVYDSEYIFEEFMDVFDTLPFAAIVDNEKLCLHGGIGPNFRSADQLYQVRRPVSEFCCDVLKSAVWSDPYDQRESYVRSPRGVGYRFNESSLNSFLERSGMKCLIRGHECVMEGVKPEFRARAITVFSASNYCGRYMNMSGVLCTSLSGEIRVVINQPLRYLRREDGHFFSFGARSFDTGPRAFSSGTFPVARPPMRIRTNSVALSPRRDSSAARRSASPPKRSSEVMVYGTRVPSPPVRGVTDMASFDFSSGVHVVNGDQIIRAPKSFFRLMGIPDTAENYDPIKQI